MDWEAAKARIYKWEQARQSGPAPDGMKRCMNCYEIMPYHEYCACLRRVGEEIRAKAKRDCEQLTKGREPGRKTTRKPTKEQGSLF
jgi:hypothetical protein